MSERSVLEPLPALVGFLRVVSSNKQFSPLAPQLPVWRYLKGDLL